MTISENRITDPTTVANAATDKALAPVSPTGTPWLPQIVVKIGTTVAILAAAIVALSQSVALPATIVSIATSVAAIAGATGWLSPGIRKAFDFAAKDVEKK